jgi:stress response protein SCP2
MFLSTFSQLLGPSAQRPLRDVAAGYDLFFGRCPLYQRRRFAGLVEQVLQVDTFPKFFQACGLSCPPKDVFVIRLREAVRASLKKCYHTQRTDFTRVQASGVSKILLKGESFTAPPTLRRVHLEDTWLFARQRAGGGMDYLDATCMLYRGSGCLESELAGTVDWRQATCLDGLVRHSGDLLDYDKQSGRHIIDVDLSQLPADITALYIVMSSFTGTLRGIQQPYLSIQDPDTLDGGNPLELCRCALDAEIAKAGQQHTSLLMCKIMRVPTNPKQWKVITVGMLGQSRATSGGGYDDVKKAIRNNGPGWK